MNGNSNGSTGSVSNPTLLCYLDASNHGDDVNTWQDLSGNGNHATLIDVTQNGSTSGWVNNTLKLLEGEHNIVTLNDNLCTVKEFTVEIRASIVVSDNDNATIFTKRTAWFSGSVGSIYDDSMLISLYAGHAEYRIEIPNIIYLECDSSFKVSDMHTLKLYCNQHTNRVVFSVDDTLMYDNIVNFNSPDSTGKLTLGNAWDVRYESSNLTIEYVKLYNYNTIITT